MSDDAAPDAVHIASHAKINVFLRILAREETGMHGIETVFALLELADEILVERVASGVALDVEGADTGPAADNLAVRAAHMVLQATGGKFGVRIHLQKNIPVQAGLGGGSSNAAATLHAVNALAGQAIPRHEILQFGARLGADVAFLASGVAMALGWSHGERLFHVNGPPPAPALLALPDAGVSTADAYRLWDRAQADPKPRGSIVLDADVLQSWGSMARLGGNDFESVVGAHQPRLRDMLERVAKTRPLLARMSGSGSAILGIYRSQDALDEAVTMLGTQDRIITTFTRSNPAPAPVAPAHETS